MISKSGYILESNRGGLEQGNFRMQSPDLYLKPIEWDSVCFVFYLLDCQNLDLQMKFDFIWSLKTPVLLL